MAAIKFSLFVPGGFLGNGRERDGKKAWFNQARSTNVALKINKAFVIA
jgi:hypothetical protein